MFYHETMTAQLLIQFMERLIRGNERKVFLILDNLRVHHSKALGKRPMDTMSSAKGPRIIFAVKIQRSGWIIRTGSFSS